MKARNTKTGEIVTHFGFSKEWGTISFVDQSGRLRQESYASGTWEIIDDGDGVDWDAFRREAAKEAMFKMLIRDFETDTYPDPQEICGMAVLYADELIKQLQEK